MCVCMCAKTTSTHNIRMNKPVLIPYSQPVQTRQLSGVINFIVHTYTYVFIDIHIYVCIALSIDYRILSNASFLIIQEL